MSRTVICCANTVDVKLIKKEILSIVKGFADKRSTDYKHHIHVDLKDIMNYVRDLYIQYICNLSISTKIFPDKRKVAKVIHLFKNGEKCVFTNY